MFVNVLSRNIVDLTFVLKQYMQFNFVNIFECFLDNCAWIFHFETVVGKLCIEANFMNVCERFKVTFICERSRQETFRTNVLGKQYVQFSFVNICECS